MRALKFITAFLLLGGCIDAPVVREVVELPAPAPYYAKLGAAGPYTWHPEWNEAIASATSGCRRLSCQ